PRESPYVRTRPVPAPVGCSEHVPTPHGNGLVRVEHGNDGKRNWGETRHLSCPTGAAVTSKRNRSATTRCYCGAGVRHRNAQEGTTPARLSRPGDATVVGAQNGTAVACHDARIDVYKRHREKVGASTTCLVVPVDASVFGPEDESSPSDADDCSNI